MGARLRYLAHDLEMPLGQFVVGRSTSCQLSLDDSMVSRRHAVFTVSESVVTVQDLGSRNGVLVNQVKIEGAHTLSDGDLVTIGQQQMTIHIARGDLPDPVLATTGRFEMKTMMNLGDMKPDVVEEPTFVGRSLSKTLNDSPPDKRVHSLSLVGAVAEKALALGRAADAERLLDRPLKELLEKAEAGQLSPEALLPAAKYAIELAKAGGDGAWVELALRLYRAHAELLPAELVDELYEVLRGVRVDRDVLTEYIESFQSSKLGPNERFTLKRLEGLRPLTAVK